MCGLEVVVDSEDVVVVVEVVVVEFVEVVEIVEEEEVVVVEIEGEAVTNGWRWSSLVCGLTNSGATSLKRGEKRERTLS